MLLVDIGNTRIKGALRGDGGLEHWPELPRDADDPLTGWNEAAREASPDRVVCANVGGPGMAAALVLFCQEAWALEPEFVVPRATLAGMTTAYDAPEQLGSDRWVAALGAWHAAKQAVCVVDAGTALTIDVVTADGVHLGGLIAPGEALMRRSLAQNTADLPQSAAAGSVQLATNTLDAIALGCRSAGVGVLETIRRQLTADARLANMQWYLTGGGAKSLAAGIDWPHELRPTLVLEGLSIVGDHL